MKLVPPSLPRSSYVPSYGLYCSACFGSLFVSYIYIYIHTINHIKYLPFLSDFNKNLIYSTDFSKIFKYKISRVAPYRRTKAQTDRQTDMTKLILVYSNSAKDPKT